MARRRGLLAEIQHQARVAERNRQHAQRQAVRAHEAASREAERAARQAELAAARAAKASEAERRAAEKEAQQLHVAAMLADVDERNAELAELDDDLSSLLSTTLDVDDFVDLESLRVTPVHPPFNRPELEAVTPPPERLQPLPEPELKLPPEPKGIGAVFKKKQHAESVAQAEADHAAAVDAWKADVADLPRRQAELDADHAKAEQQRLAELATERDRYAAECAAREQDAAAANKQLDDLIANLGYGTPAAIEEYVGIVLSNSVYPDTFPVEPDEYSFEPQTAELRLRMLVPAPDTLPDSKAYRYVKAQDEITSSPLSQKAQRDRYASAVHQVALRSLHEVFEADRRALIQAISLEVGTQTVSPATGLPTYIPFVAVAAHRDTFLGMDLAAVIPSATLDHLGAAVSKNPHGLVPIDPSGVRKS